MTFWIFSEFWKVLGMKYSKTATWTPGLSKLGLWVLLAATIMKNWQPFKMTLTGHSEATKFYIVNKSQAKINDPYKNECRPNLGKIGSLWPLRIYFSLNQDGLRIFFKLRMFSLLDFPPKLRIFQGYYNMKKLETKYFLRRVKYS